MSRFRKHGDGIESRLRAGRPEARDELVAAVAARVREDRSRQRGGSFRLAFAGVLSAAMLVALASVGGIGYAASSVDHAVVAVRHLVLPAKQRAAISLLSLTAGSDQYRPGFGFGDPNHNHTGPPGIVRRGGALAPPLTARLSDDGKAYLVGANLTFDEQAHLTISVMVGGKKLLLTQKGSRSGARLNGPQTKNVQYLLLVPRSLPLDLRIPASLLKPGRTYAIRIRARDADGNVRFITIPFRLP